MSDEGAHVRIERVDRPYRTLLSLGVRRGALRGFLIIDAGPRVVRVGFVDARPKGDAIDSQGMALRDALVGARLDGLEQSRDAVRLALRTLDGPRVLEIKHQGGLARAAIEDGVSTLPAIDLEGLRARGDVVLAEASRDAARTLLAPYARRAKTAIARAERTAIAVAQEAARADDAEALRTTAQLLLTQHARLPRGAREANVIDYATTPPTERRIVLVPDRSAKETAEAMFARARKLERGRARAEERARVVAAEREKLIALREAIVACETMEDALALAERAATLGLAPEAQVPRGTATPRARLPYRRFVARDGTEIWVGRSAAENDALTVRTARPHHVFFHVRGSPGSHVIVALAKNAALSQEALLDAATLAVHFSSLRGEAIVEVSYVPRKHVRKPKGAAPGSVTVTREKVLGLRFEPARLERLIRTELGTLGAQP